MSTELKHFSEYKELTKLVLQAHHNLTRKKGQPEYTPTAREIATEINSILTKIK